MSTGVFCGRACEAGTGWSTGLGWPTAGLRIESSLCCVAGTCAGDAKSRPSQWGRSSTSYVPCCSCPTSCVPTRGLPERAGSTHRQRHLGQHAAYRVFPATRMRRMQAPHASADGRTVGLWAGTRACGCAQGKWRQGSSVGFVIDRALSHAQTPCPSDENRQTPLE
jgi:hypothetical protein